MAININTKELKNLLESTPATHNIMLSGKHGIGKSKIITDFFTAKGQKVVTLFLGQMSDPGDLIGLPNKDEATGKTVFMPPYWFPTDDQPVVLFLDELNRARPEILPLPAPWQPHRIGRERRRGVPADRPGPGAGVTLQYL